MQVKHDLFPLRVILISSMVLLGVVLFSGKALATQTILNTSENLQAGCGAGENTNCGGARGAGRNVHWQQLVDFSQFYNQNFTFNEVQVPMCIATGGTAQGTATSHMFLIRTEDQYNQAVADGLWSTHASSTSAESFISGSACGGASNTTTTTNNFSSIVTWNFTSPVTISTTTPAYAFVWDQQIGGMAEVYTGVSKTIWHTQQSGSPFVSARLNNSYISYNGSGMDYGMKIISDETALSFTNPTQNETLNDYPLLITGTCQYDVEVQLYNGTTYASSTSAYGATRTCSSNQFNWPVSITQGYWNLIADSPVNNTHTAIVFYYSAQSSNAGNFPEGGGALPITTSTPQWSTSPETSIDSFLLGLSCNIPFIEIDLCSMLGHGAYNTKNFFLYGITNGAFAILSQKPYSYINDTWRAVQLGITTQPSNTSTIPIANVIVTSTPYFTFNQSLFNAGMFTAILDQDKWDSMRPYENAFLYLVFALYLLGLLKRLI